MNTEHCHAVDPCRPSTTPAQDAMISGYVEFLGPRLPGTKSVIPAPRFGEGRGTCIYDGAHFSGAALKTTEERTEAMKLTQRERELMLTAWRAAAEQYTRSETRDFVIPFQTAFYHWLNSRVPRSIDGKTVSMVSVEEAVATDAPPPEPVTLRYWVLSNDRFVRAFDCFDEAEKFARGNAELALDGHQVDADYKVLAVCDLHIVRHQVVMERAPV